jgi:hypothetical protein
VTELKPGRCVERTIHVPQLGTMVVSIDRIGVKMRRPGQRRASAYEVPWFNVHGQGARLRAAEKAWERKKKRLAQSGR